MYHVLGYHYADKLPLSTRQGSGVGSSVTTVIEGAGVWVNEEETISSKERGAGWFNSQRLKLISLRPPCTSPPVLPIA